MKKNKLINRLFFVGGLLALSQFQTATAENGETIFAVDTANKLIRFDSENSNVIDDSMAITGLQPGENILGIDFRPATNELFAFGSTGRAYTLGLDTGAATAVTTAPLTITGTQFGFDFNPTVDKIRLVSDQEENVRIDPLTGNLFMTDAVLNYDPGDLNSGQNPNVTASAYTNNSLNQTVTNLFGIDSTLNILVRQGGVNGAVVSPNSGVLYTIGALGVDVNDNIGFDVSESNKGKAFASFTLNGETVSKLYAIDLSGGHATFIGTIGGGAQIRDIAVARGGAFRFNQVSYPANENSPLTLTIERVGSSSNPIVSGTPQPVTVSVTTVNGTAGAADFTPVNAQLVSFAEGEVKKDVQVTLTNDTTPELAENFSVKLSNPTGGALIQGSDTAAVTVIDDDLTNNNIQDLQPPFVHIDFEGTYPKSRFLVRGLPVDTICSENCSIKTELLVNQSTANRYRVGTTLGTLQTSINGNLETRLFVPVIPSYRTKILRKCGDVSVTVRTTATDANANSSVKERRVRVVNDVRSCRR